MASLPDPVRSSPNLNSLPAQNHLLLADGPDFVNLDSTAGQLAHLLTISRAALSDFNYQPADRVAVRSGHALCAADRISLDQAIDDLNTASERYAVGS
jgi:hypothetical protein